MRYKQVAFINEVHHLKDFACFKTTPTKWSLKTRRLGDQRARHVQTGEISPTHVSKTLCLSLYTVGHKQFLSIAADWDTDIQLTDK